MSRIVFDGLEVAGDTIELLDDCQEHQVEVEPGPAGPGVPLLLARRSRFGRLPA